MKKKEYRQAIRSLEGLVERQNQRIVELSLEQRSAGHKLLAAYNQHLTMLNPNDRYDLLEELMSGEPITHLRSVTLDKLKQYVNQTFIHSHPPKLIFRLSAFDPDQEYENFSDELDEVDDNDETGWLDKLMYPNSNKMKITPPENYD